MWYSTIYALSVKKQKFVGGFKKRAISRLLFPWEMILAEFQVFSSEL